MVLQHFSIEDIAYELQWVNDKKIIRQNQWILYSKLDLPFSTFTSTGLNLTL